MTWIEFIQCIICLYTHRLIYMHIYESVYLKTLGQMAQDSSIIQHDRSNWQFLTFKLCCCEHILDQMTTIKRSILIDEKNVLPLQKKGNSQGQFYWPILEESKSALSVHLSINGISFFHFFLNQILHQSQNRQLPAERRFLIAILRTNSLTNACLDACTVISLLESWQSQCHILILDFDNILKSLFPKIGPLIRDSGPERLDSRRWRDM